jgi:hypothetical protein
VEEIARSGPGGARILDGAAAARHLRDRVRAESEALGGRPAALRLILLGNAAASETYLAAKTKAAREAGIRAETVRLPSGSSPEALLAEVEKANRDERAKCSGAKPESPNFERLPALLSRGADRSGRLGGV